MALKIRMYQKAENVTKMNRDKLVRSKDRERINWIRAKGKMQRMQRMKRFALKRLFRKGEVSTMVHRYVDGMFMEMNVRSALSFVKRPQFGQHCLAFELNENFFY